VTRILRDADDEDGAAQVADWLECEWDAPGTQETAGPVDTLRQGIAMAEGSRTPSVGYTVGQVWRHWQNRLRAGFNPARPPAETAALIVGFVSKRAMAAILAGIAVLYVMLWWLG